MTLCADINRQKGFKVKKSTMYKRAAKNIANDKAQVCCCAINTSMLRYNPLLRQDFVQLFKPPGAYELACWYGSITPDNQMARSLALLFMAEIAKETEV